MRTSRGHGVLGGRFFREREGRLLVSESYTYDSLNRLTAFQRGNLDEDKDEIPTTGNNRVRGQACTLSATGNWTEFKLDDNGDGDYSDTGTEEVDQDRTHNDVNEIWNETAGAAITEISGQPAWHDPDHDARGNMTTIPKPTDLDLAGGLTCTYDSWNRLIEVSDGETLIQKNEYDGLNRRIKKHADTDAPDEPDDEIDEYVHYFYNAGWQVLETRTATSENDQPENLDPKYQYVWSLPEESAKADGAL